MDFRPIKQFVEGDACVNCWGPGKTFGDVPTPKRLTMIGSGFAGACAVCNGTFILVQDVVTPCLWRFDNGTTIGSYRLHVASSDFSMGISGGANCYFRVEGLCQTVSTFAGITVSVSIDEPPTPEWKHAYNQNFSPTRPTYFQNFGSVGSDEVLMISKRSDQIRAAIKFSPDY